MNFGDWFKINKSLFDSVTHPSVKYLTEKYQWNTRISCSVPGASGQPYGGKCLLWESGVGGVGISGRCDVSKLDYFNVSFSPRSGMYLTWGRLAFHRSQPKYLHGQESSVLWLIIWPSKHSTPMCCWQKSCVQPVLDFLLWHHLGPNYEERAHDLLQVNILKTRISIDF